MNKYTHSKTKPLSIKQQRSIDRRKVNNHVTTERMFGAHHPKFGSSLGVSYSGATGVIFKLARASSVS